MWVYHCITKKYISFYKRILRFELNIYKSPTADEADSLSRKLTRAGYFLSVRVKPNELKQTEMEYQEDKN